METPESHLFLKNRNVISVDSVNERCIYKKSLQAYLSKQDESTQKIINKTYRTKWGKKREI